MEGELSIMAVTGKGKVVSKMSANHRRAIDKIRTMVARNPNAISYFLPDEIPVICHHGFGFPGNPALAGVRSLLGICFWRECLEAAFGPERRGENGGWL